MVKHKHHKPITVAQCWRVMLALKASVDYINAKQPLDENVNPDYLAVTRAMGIIQRERYRLLNIEKIKTKKDAE